MMYRVNVDLVGSVLGPRWTVTIYYSDGAQETRSFPAKIGGPLVSSAEQWIGERIMRNKWMSLIDSELVRKVRRFSGLEQEASGEQSNG